MTLSTAQLNALPPGSAVRYATERGMRPALALKLGGYGSESQRWASTDSMAPIGALVIAGADPVLLAAHPAPETDGVHFSPYGSSTSSCGLTKPRDEMGFTDRRALTTCTACRERLAPAPVSDTRREDVAAAFWAWLDRYDAPWSPSDAKVADLVTAVLAALPAPPVVDETTLGDLWDDGNAVGLDGWVGPGRGEPVDDHAVNRREQAVYAALARLRGEGR